MSYVIQNFYDYHKKIKLNPRFKIFFFLNNLEKFFIFIKINTLFNINYRFNNLYLFYFNLFFKYFFSKYYVKLIYNFNLKLINNYTNNLTKSSIYFFFFNFNNFFSLKKVKLLKFKVLSLNFQNTYLTPIKTLNISLTNSNNLYRNVFFYLLLINPFIWYQNSSSFFFYLNYIFINYTLKIFRFYNGYFLRIYNY